MQIKINGAFEAAKSAFQKYQVIAPSHGTHHIALVFTLSTSRIDISLGSFKYFYMLSFYGMPRWKSNLFNEELRNKNLKMRILFSKKVYSYNLSILVKNITIEKSISI